MRTRSFATAAAAAVLLAAVAGPAAARGTAVSTTRPAAGTATSSLTLLSLALAGHDVKVGSVALTSDTVAGSPTAKVVVTPVNADGKAYGEQTVTPASSPASVPSFDSSSALPAALGTVASVKSPVFNISSSTASGASNKAGAASLGSVKILGLPVSLDGSVDVSSLVDGTNALGEKTLTVKNVALPSIADLLAALGLDLSKLPTKTLTDLLAGLNLTDPAVTAASQALATAQATIQGQIDAAQKQLDAANAQVKTATDTLAKNTAAANQALGAVTAANAAAATAKTAADQAASAFNGHLAAASAVLPPGTTVATFGALPPATQSLAEGASSGTLAAFAAYNDAATKLAAANSTAAAAAAAQALADAAVGTAKTALTAAQAAVDAAFAALNALLGQLSAQIKSLLAAVTAVLDKTPLVSIDSFTVQTQALVKSATSGGQTAKVVGGEIQGVHVLGTDVLNNVLGSSKVNLLDLTSGALAQVTSKVNGLTGVLSSVLSAVPGLTVPAPSVQVLSKTASTGIADGFGTAQNSVSALKVSLPAITLPAALALPNAAQLPAFTGVPNLGINAVGDLTSKSIALSLGTLSERASFRPATTATTPETPTTPTTPTTPELPRTGLPVGIAIFGILMVAGALLLRRRFGPAPQAGTEV